MLLLREVLHSCTVVGSCVYHLEETASVPGELRGPDQGVR